MQLTLAGQFLPHAVWLHLQIQQIVVQLGSFTAICCACSLQYIMHYLYPTATVTSMLITITVTNMECGECRKLSLVAPPPHAGALSSAGLLEGLPPSPSTCSPGYRRPDWLLFNDFCIAPCASAEVLTLFGNQKIPCLLYYSMVSTSCLSPALPAFLFLLPPSLSWAQPGLASAFSQAPVQCSSNQSVYQVGQRL